MWSFTPPDENNTSNEGSPMTSLVGEEDRGAMTPVEDEDEDEEDEDDGVDDGPHLDEEDDGDIGDENADPRATASAARGSSGSRTNSQSHVTIRGDNADGNNHNKNNNILKMNVGNMAAIDDGGVSVGAIGAKSSSSSPTTGDGDDDGISTITTNTITSRTGSNRGVSTPDLGDGIGDGSSF